MSKMGITQRNAAIEKVAKLQEQLTQETNALEGMPRGEDPKKMWEYSSSEDRWESNYTDNPTTYTGNSRLVTVVDPLREAWKAQVEKVTGIQRDLDWARKVVSDDDAEIHIKVGLLALFRPLDGKSIKFSTPKFDVENNGEATTFMLTLCVYEDSIYVELNGTKRDDFSAVMWRDGEWSDISHGRHSAWVRRHAEAAQEGLKAFYAKKSQVKK